VSERELVTTRGIPTCHAGAEPVPAMAGNGIHATVRMVRHPCLAVPPTDVLLPAFAGMAAQYKEREQLANEVNACGVRELTLAPTGISRGE
jgi:hypothetical protein